MKRRLLTVVSALGLALILSSCSELSYELSEAEQQELGVESISAADVVEDILTGQGGESQETQAENEIVDEDGQDDDQDADEQSAETDTQDADDDGNAEQEAGQSEENEEDGSADYVDYYFRSSKLLNSHYEKHGIEMGFASAKEYEKAASDVVNNPAALHKTEAEDGDDVYYVEETNEFVVVSTDGYIRTYFNPGGGIDYYNRQ
ncbi:MAG: hypothetical protein K5659_03130 [Lachnospiraceae bacterium]|nr:hypothetical protein [Lachnospiraceae bacterium]